MISQLRKIKMQIKFNGSRMINDAKQRVANDAALAAHALRKILSPRAFTEAATVVVSTLLAANQFLRSGKSQSSQSSIEQEPIQPMATFKPPSRIHQACDVLKMPIYVSPKQAQTHLGIQDPKFGAIFFKLPQSISDDSNRTFAVGPYASHVNPNGQAYNFGLLARASGKNPIINLGLIGALGGNGSINVSPVFAVGGDRSISVSPVFAGGGDRSINVSPVFAGGGDGSRNRSVFMSRGGNKSNNIAVVDAVGGNSSANLAAFYAGGGQESLNVGALVAEGQESSQNTSLGFAKGGKLSHNRSNLTISDECSKNQEFDSGVFVQAAVDILDGLKNSSQ